MRVLYRFAKKERLRFVSHLDLQRFMQRALNRTSLKIAYSNGFNPHPILSFASALAIGWTSEYELFDIKLAEPVSRNVAMEEMERALPPDLPILDARLVEDKHPALMGRLVMADIYHSSRGRRRAHSCRNGRILGARCGIGHAKDQVRRKTDQYTTDVYFTRKRTDRIVCASDAYRARNA